MTDRKKPGVAFWATVVVVVALLAYPLSFGPACWISSRTGMGVYKLPTLYRPILYAMSCSRRAANLCRWYAEVGAPSDWNWVDVSDSAAPIWLWGKVAP
jgi:hypothetical protein